MMNKTKITEVEEQTIIVIPTVNEIENIHIIKDIFNTHPLINVLIVDDNSTDGTVQKVYEFMKVHSNLSLISREKKLGLGTAYIEGMKSILTKGHKYILTMDADFSHPIKSISSFISNADQSVLQIGSRYTEGASIIGWSFKRLLLSKLSGSVARLITGLEVKDITSGFNFVPILVIQNIGIDSFLSKNFIFQVELKFKAKRSGYKLKEIPITFRDRLKGKSKMSFSVILEGFFSLIKLRFEKS